ncbi:MAG: glycosyltransferase family 4 protein [Deltaproteobacteria bacterium]|nr:glycosyltransferase family 4 protein [Deltaproteobacteria bacterium]MBW2136229.1 glycosyltransferase family 4 protein [Deltaproteobacteria bacterium]
MKKIGFISTRIAGTDGVSLEIYKWYQVLERNGYKCHFFAGELDTPPERSLLEPNAHFETAEIREIHDALVGTTRRENALSKKIQELKDYLKEKLYEFCDVFGIDIIIPENALAIPMNVPLGMAITELIAETGIPAVAHHHDFSWERNRYLINAMQDYIHYAFPPTLNSIRHVVINSAASRQLSYRRGISNVIIPNVFDFESPTHPSPNGKKLKKELGLDEKDLFVLQPTRVVPRKWIERAVELVSLLELKNPKLVVSHETGDEGDLYAERVLEYAHRLGVEVIYMGDRVGTARCFKEVCQQKYTIDDVYLTADVVTYPSGYEGFGNAFLEAIYFRKPIVVNRYSIFIEDIEPCGFEVISFESFVTKKIVDRLREFLDGENLDRFVDKNYELGRRYFSYKVLEERLLPLIESFR